MMTELALTRRIFWMAKKSMTSPIQMPMTVMKTTGTKMVEMPIHGSQTLTEKMTGKKTTARLK